MPLRHRIAWLLTGAATLAIMVATLHTAGALPTRGWSWYLVSGNAALAELLQNLILFIPFGVGLALAGVRPGVAMLLGAALSFSVEFAQQWIPGRDPSLGDLVCNTLSTTIGVGVVRTYGWWRRTPPLVAAACTILVWLGTALLLTHTRRAHLISFEWLNRGPHTLGEAWQLIFHPDSFPTLVFTILNAAWLGAWMAAVGYLSKGRGGTGIAAIALTLAALIAIPALTHLQPTPIIEWLGAGIGLGLGWLVSPTRHETIPAVGVIPTDS